MESLKAYADGLVEKSPTATAFSQDKVLGFFKQLHDQQAELVDLKVSTLRHAWIRTSAKGKLELVALDAEFDIIQRKIADLDSVVTAGAATASELDEFYRIHNLPPISYGQIQKKRATIETDLRGHKARAAGASVGSKGRENMEAAVAVFERDAREIDAVVDEIDAILQYHSGGRSVCGDTE